MTEASVHLNPAAVLDRDRHFHTVHLAADLKGRSVRGGAVTVFGQGIKFILNTGSTAILAHLLTPADFGLVAMVAAFTGFVGLFRNIGLAMATVQRASITHEQVSTLFWINVALSVLLASVCAALAPAVALFYGEPRLVWVTLAISATFIFAGLSAQHAALLQRQMRFGTLAVIDIAGMTAGIIAAIALALMHAQYWALVAMMAAQSFAVMVGIWLASGWRPGWPHRGSGVIPLLKFGGNLTGFNVLDYLTRNVDNILIGQFLGAGPLGVYSKAYNLLMMPIRQINSPMGAVALPALCRLQHSPTQYRQYFFKAIEIVSLVGMPLVAFTFVAADDLILTLLGPQWTSAIPVFRWLAPAAFIGTMSVIPDWLCNSLGHTHRLFRWAMVAAPITIAGCAVGLRWGPTGVAAGFSITWCISFLVLVAYSCSGTPVRFQDIMLRLWYPVCTSVLAAVSTIGVCSRLPPYNSHSLRALCGAIVFALCVLGIHLLNPLGRKSLRELATVRAHFRPRALEC